MDDKSVRIQHHVAWLSEIGEGELMIYAEKLVGLGIYRARDLIFVREEDLIKAGIPLVAARRLLSASQKPPEEVSMMMGPQKTLNAAAEAGILRGQRPAGVVVASSIIGGSLLGFGGCMYVMVGGGSLCLVETMPGIHKILAAGVFPIGLSMVVFTGTDLLTSNMMYHSLPFLTHPHRNISLQRMCRMWSLSFIGNLIGSVALAAAAAHYIFPMDPWSSYASAIAMKKVSMPVDEIFIKAVGANWLVNVAVYMALTSRSAGGKIVALWLPITTFVTLGLEHAVANMYLIPLGIFSGADVTWEAFFVNNLMPCCAGNLVGAVFFTSFLPYYTDWYPILRNKANKEKRAGK